MQIPLSIQLFCLIAQYRFKYSFVHVSGIIFNCKDTY